MRNIGEVYQGEFRHALLELAEARVHKLLALLGHVVLSVLTEVAERSSLLDLLRQLVLELMLHLPDLFF
jgi:spore maturation protein SpmA